MPYLVRSLRSWSSTLKQRVIDFFSPPDELIVRFPSDQDILESLDATNPALREIIVLFNKGDGANAKPLLVSYFKHRQRPRFFIDRDDLVSAVSKIEAQHPTWRDKLLEDAQNWLKDTRATAERNKASGSAPSDDTWRGQQHLLHFAPLMARAALFEEPYQAVLANSLKVWMTSAETGVNPAGYSSCLLSVFRVVALTWTLAFLGGGKKENIELEYQILRVLLFDARFLASRLGTSFPNNHLLADGFALWYLGTLFPEFSEAQSWKEKGEQTWLREFRRQIYPDGTSFEHSVHYQELACEMAVAYLLLKRRNDEPLDDEIVQRIERMLAFQADMSGPEAIPMPLGDTGDDSLMSFDANDKWGCAGHREIYRSLFNPGLQPVYGDHRGVERAFWLLGGKFPPPASAVIASRFASYPDGGNYIFPESDARTRVVFRTGPNPGSTVNPGHMHADLLSIYLHLQGKPVIVEAGTYTYRSAAGQGTPGEPCWRAYFLGPKAHNGLYIEGEDPLNRGGGNFPGKPIQSRVNSHIFAASESMAWVEGENVGTTQYAGHRRGVVHIPGHYWVLYDVLPETVACEKVSYGLQLAPDASVTSSDEAALVVRVEQAGLWIASSDSLALPALYQGDPDSPAGWVSPRYGELRPAPMLRYSVVSSVNPSAMVFMPADKNEHPPKIEACRIGEVGFGFKVSYGQFTDYILMHSKVQYEQYLDAWGIRFGGTALWLQTRGGVPSQLRWVDGKHVVWAEPGLSILAKNPSPELEVLFNEAGIQTKGTALDQLEVEWQTVKV